MTELYTAAQLVLFPLAAVDAIIGSFSVVCMAAGVMTGDAWKVVRGMVVGAACTGAMWAYLMIPGGLG